MRIAIAVLTTWSPIRRSFFSSALVVSPATVLSTRDSLVPIINNPRNKFLQTDRALASKRIEFKEAVTANNKISASNKITLV